MLQPFEGAFMLALYFAAMIVMVLMIRKHEKTKSEFLVAGRKASWIFTAFSVAATWVWAPSMFTAAEKAYTQGLDGVFWFVVPNVATLVLFAFFAVKMRKLRPEGWTFTSYIREKFSKRTHNMFLIQSVVLQICSIAINLLAGGVVFSKICGLPFFATTCVMALIPLAYTFATGIRSSINTDFIKMGFIAITLIAGLPIMFTNAGTDTFMNGLGGITGEFSGLFDKAGIAVMLGFGIPSTITLLSGTFGDQMFWQRSFCVPADKVKRTFLLAAAIFAIVPISLSMFGFFVAGSGIEVADKQLINVTAVLNFCPRWFLYFFFVVLLSGLISTVDSVMCAVSSISGHDIIQRLKEKPNKGILTKILLNNEVGTARLAMVIITILGICIANIPGLTITYLWLLYGTMRSSILIPTIEAIRCKKMSEKGLFYGLLFAWIIGMPIFGYGNFVGDVNLTLAGSVFTILCAGLMAKFAWRKEAVS